MEPFITHKGKVVPLDRSNVDTDAIIPKEFLKRIEQTGFGEFLFYDWRYSIDGKVKEDFNLNKPIYQDATILLTKENFGSGSSREHAPWALLDYGIKVIIASSFADIFYNNSFKNGLLLIKQPKEVIEKLFAKSELRPQIIDIDLVNQTIKFDEQTFLFEIDPYHKKMLVEGLDEIGMTLEKSKVIDLFEINREQWLTPQKNTQQV